MRQDSTGSPVIFLAKCLIAVAVLVVVAVSSLSFSTWLAFWLLGLSCLTAWRPWLGVPLLFATISVDVEKPVLAGVVVSFSELAFAGCVLGWLFSAVEAYRDWDWRPVRWGAPFSAAVLLSGLINCDLYRVAPHVLRSSELMVAMLLAANALGNGKPKDIFKWALAATACFYSMTGLLQFPAVFGWRAYSFFTNPNQFASYLNLLAPPMLAWLLFTRKFAQRWIGAVCLALIGLAQLAAQSRAAMLGLASASILMAALAIRSARGGGRQPGGEPVLAPFRQTAPVLVMAVILALGGAVAAWRVEGSAFSAAWKVLVQRETLSQRIPFLEVGWRLWRGHFFFGVGPGNYKESLEQANDFVESVARRLPPTSNFRRVVRIHTHCLYLQLGVNFGLVGLCAFVGWMWMLWREFWSRLDQSPWSLAGVGVLAAFFIHNLFDVTFPGLAMETGFVLGFLLATSGRGAPSVAKP